MDTVPGILRPRKRFSIDTITPEDVRASTGTGTGTGTGTCPNPAHKGRVFVKHASERYSWERRIAGLDVGGAVALRWRGCLGTCLDFLDEAVWSELRRGGGGPGVDPSSSPTTPTLGQDEENNVDVDMAVQAVDLGHVSLDMEDFDD